MMRVLKRLAWLRWPAAIALLVALAWHEGISGAFALIARTGPVLLWLVPLHALPLLLDARAWHLLLDERIPLPALWWIAVVREAVGRLLPVLGIGGELAGIRLATRYMQDVSRVSASVIVEVLVTIAVQYALAMLGLALLHFHASDAAGGIGGLIGVGLVVSLPVALAAFVVAHRGAPFHRLEAMARRWLDPAHALAARLDGRRLDHDIRTLLQRTPLLARAFAWQFAGYVLGAAEIYAALDMLGHPVPVAGAVAIEALVQAVRNAVFIAPAGLGVQEAAIVAIAAAFGVDRDAAFSLALLRRVREFAWGGIALLLLRVTEPQRPAGLARERG
jgi:putative membrane protein